MKWRLPFVLATFVCAGATTAYASVSTSLTGDPLGSSGPINLGASVTWNSVAACSGGDPEETWVGDWVMIQVSGSSGFLHIEWFSLSGEDGNQPWGGTDYFAIPGDNVYYLEASVGYRQQVSGATCYEEANPTQRTVNLPGGGGGEDPPPSTVMLSSCEELYADQSVYGNGYMLTYQSDGNFVLYSGSTPIWATGTDGTNPGRAIMQCDGNLVVYDSGENPVWDSGTYGNSGAYLAIDGSTLLIIFEGTLLWSS